MKHSKQRNIKFAVMFVVLVGLVGFLVSEELTGNPNLGAGKTFSLPPANSFKDIGGAQVDVECKIKQELTIVDSNGKTITIKQSSGIMGSPTFNIVNPLDTNQEASVFVVIPKIYCDAKGIGVVVEKSDLKLEVSARGLSQTSGGFAFTENIRYQSEIKFNKDFSNNDEKNLGWFSINDRDIESVISERDWTGNLVFDVTGNIVMYYDDPKLKSYKMTIPIESGDLVSSWKFTNVGENETVVDGDNDGIKDNADACPSSKETYNGYQDTDGCPDTVPVTPTPIAPVTPVDKNSCNADGNYWTYSGTASICVDKTFGDNVIKNCNDNNYTWVQRVNESDNLYLGYDDYEVVDHGYGMCVLTDDVSDVIDAEIKFQVDIINNDKTKQAFQVADDPSPFSFDIPLTSLVGGQDGVQKTTASFKVEPRLVIDDPKVHSLTTTKQSNLKIETIVKHDGNEYSLGEKRVSNFITTNGGGFDSSIGFSLGSVTIMASEIQNKVPLTEIPMGSSDYVSVRFLVSGDIGIITNDYGTIKNIYDLDISGADFEITNLKIIRGDSNPIANPQKTNCDNATENVITINGVSECIPKGSACDDTNECANPNPPIIGAVGTLICQDNSAIGGGFPCTEEYRINYCGGKDSTFCNVPNDIIKPVIPEITPIDDECPNDGIQSLSVVEGMCLVTGGTTTTSGGETTTSGGNGVFDLTPNAESDNYLLYGAIGVGLLGFIAFLIKRRN